MNTSHQGTLFSHTPLIRTYIISVSIWGFHFSTLHQDTLFSQTPLIRTYIIRVHIWGFHCIIFSTLHLETLFSQTLLIRTLFLDSIYYKCLKLGVPLYVCSINLCFIAELYYVYQHITTGWIFWCFFFFLEVHFHVLLGVVIMIYLSTGWTCV